MKAILLAVFVAAGLSPSCAPAAAADPGARGWFGFSAKVAAEKFAFDPTITSIMIGKVEADSPAARAGLISGDEVIELEGVKVVGRKASELKPLMEKAAGEILHLRLKREDRAEYSVKLTAAPKP